MLRERAARVAAQCVGVDGAACDVADQPLVPYDDDCLGDVRVVGEGGLHLAGFDTEAADLDLVVGPARVLQPTVRRPACQVARAVHALAGPAEGVGHEPPGRQPRPAQVPARQARPGDVQLAGHARWYEPQPRVQDIGAQVGDGVPDGAGGGACPVLGQGEARDMDRRLCDAVHVDQHGRFPRVPGEPLGDPREVECLAAEHHVSQGQLLTE